MLHAYLRERLRDFRDHGFCILERDLIDEDESIWDGHAHDLFNEEILRHMDGAPPLMVVQPNGDMLVKNPSTPEEMARAIAEAKNEMNQTINEAAYSDDGVMRGRGRVVQ